MSAGPVAALLAALGAFFAIFAMGPTAVAGDTPKLPNIVLITIDTLRADHTTLGGYPLPTTPALARLAEQGVSIAPAYAPVSTTAPTHASLFTGRYPHSHRLIKNGLPLAPEAKTLAETLTDHGYQTAAVVSSFALDAKFGFDQGFASYADDFPKANSTMALEQWVGHEVAGGFDQRADVTTEMATRALRSRQPGVPLFLFVHYFDPHAPYDPPEPYRKRFGADLDPNAPQEVLVRRWARSRYDAEIAFVDDEIANLIDAIDRLGLAQQTLVVVTSDHGEGLQEHGFWMHGYDVYDESIEVPLVVRWVGRIPAGRTLAGPVELIDVMPTVLDLIGVEWDRGATDGRSLAPALLGEASLDPKRPVFLYRSAHEQRVAEGRPIRGEHFAVRQQGWKLIEYTGDEPSELYDLSQDPDEQENLFAPSNPQAMRLGETLADWKRRYVSDFAVPEVSEEDRKALEKMGYLD